MSAYKSKRRKALAPIHEQTKGKALTLKDAIQTLRQGPKTKFDQSLEIQFKLGVDLTANDQVVRGTTVLPHGQGKKLRVIVFCRDENVKLAKDAGAVEVGAEDLIEKVLGGWMDFDVAVSTPMMMKEVGKLGKALGPRGLMPSPKAGTVTDKPANAVKEVMSGRIEFKMDKFANMHTLIGKLSFSDAALYENGAKLVESVLHAKPKTLKGTYIKGAHLSSSMGPGIKLDLSKFVKELETAAD